MSPLEGGAPSPAKRCIEPARGAQSVNALGIAFRLRLRGFVGGLHACWAHSTGDWRPPVLWERARLRIRDLLALHPGAASDRPADGGSDRARDRKSTRLNSSH